MKRYQGNSNYMSNNNLKNALGFNFNNNQEQPCGLLNQKEVLADDFTTQDCHHPWPLSCLSVLELTNPNARP